MARKIKAQPAPEPRPAPEPAPQAFMMAWGDLIYSLTFLQKQELQPATVGLYGYIGSDYADWNKIMAFATVMTLPVIAAFLLLQRWIVQGLTAGALK